MSDEKREGKVLTLPINATDVAVQLLTEILSEGAVLQAELIDETITSDNLVEQLNTSTGCRGWLMQEVFELVSRKHENQMQEEDSLKDLRKMLTELPEDDPLRDSIMAIVDHIELMENKDVEKI